MSKETPRTVLNAENPNRLDFIGSSNLISATFDPATKEIEVEMKGGPKYRYANFTPQKLGAWMSAPSAGKWFSENLRNSTDHPITSRPADPFVPSASATEPDLKPAQDPEALPSPPAAPVAAAASPQVKTSPDAGAKATRYAVNFDEAKPEDQARARRAYEAYGENSRWLTFDGRQMPAWDSLSVAVRSHWTASIAPMIRETADTIANADARVQTAEREVDLAKADVVKATEKLAKSPGQREHDRLQAEITELKANPATARAAMLDAEVDKVRHELAKVEAENRQLKAAAAGREIP